MNNQEKWPYEESPEERTEKLVKSFEDMANEIYQANAAAVSLGGLEKDPSLISEEQRQRLFGACNMGMEINPDDSKEYRQFKDFKERLESLFAEK